MNPSSAIVERLRQNAALTAALVGIVGNDESRETAVYDSPLDPAEGSPTREAFLSIDPSPYDTTLIATPLPSIYVNPGRGPVDHPESRKIPYLVDFWPVIWCYVPELPGIDAYGIQRDAFRIVFESLHEHRFLSPYTALGCRVTLDQGWGARRSIEFANTVNDFWQYRVTTRLKEES